MFKKHSVQMKIVKDAPITTDSVSDYVVKLNNTERVINDTILSTARVAVGMLAAKTLSEIALHVIKTQIK